jgi:hypothetical protein
MRSGKPSRGDMVLQRHRANHRLPIAPGVARWLLSALMMVVLVAVGVVAGDSGVVPRAAAAPQQLDVDEAGQRPAWERTPGVEATFLRDSYAPETKATFTLWRRERAFSLQILRAEPGKNVPPMVSSTYMHGTPMSKLLHFGPTEAHVPVSVSVGNWRSGVYFAKLKAGGRVGFAPFLVRPRALGTHAVAVVVPTFTWQAYNRRDDDGNGYGDTWYTDSGAGSVELVRPFLNRGVPPHFRNYVYPFLNWLDRTGKQVDFLSDSDLDAAHSTSALTSAYRLIVFPGHHEYVTAREYDLIERYRDRGGHLMFLSANNFFWKVVRKSGTLTRIARWRTLGRPEAALIGVQYIWNDRGQNQGAYTVRSSSQASWLFRGTGLRIGSSFGRGGIEIDHVAPSSPRGITVVADIPNLMGPGKTPQMTYYETPAGAKVFAAGSFTLAGARDPIVGHILQNLWNRLTAAPGGSSAPSRPEETAQSCGRGAPGKTPRTSASPARCADE